ncbi:MAG TPA: GGDEF domain-containing protein, partial [Spirochaetia bacterium]|nr:GGDEF domain-containing protein [Spirochaetia bacterium]
HLCANCIDVCPENALEFRKLDREAGLDWLTNLPTRRRFDFRARAYLEGPAEDTCFCVVMMDLDRFKAVNDTFGHKAGDQGLAAAARVCREALRSTDLVCRYGGEEIALLLPGADGKAGHAVAERIRTGVEALRFPDYPEMRLTVSLGVRVSCGGTRDLSVLLAESDQALYRAKAEGRNRVILSDPEAPTD